MIDLSNKIAWVTGGARGIGKSIVDELSRQGATVYVSDRYAQPGVEECDATDPAAIDVFAKSILGRSGRLDILVNNAAVQRRRAFTDFSSEDYDAIFSTNVRGSFFAAQSAARVMIEAGVGGSIVNIGSVNAEHAQPETALYCASKGACQSMTKALAVGLGKYGIRVNSVAPGTIATELNQDRLSRQEAVAGVIERTALGRLGAPDDVAPAVAFLASDAARFVTGATIAVHGGWTLMG